MVKYYFYDKLTRNNNGITFFYNPAFGLFANRISSKEIQIGWVEYDNFKLNLTTVFLGVQNTFYKQFGYYSTTSSLGEISS